MKSFWILVNFLVTAVKTEELQLNLRADSLKEITKDLVAWSEAKLYRKILTLDVVIVGDGEETRELSLTFMDKPVRIITKKEKFNDIMRNVAKNDDSMGTVLISSYNHDDLSIDVLFNAIKHESESFVIIYGTRDPMNISWKNDYDKEKHLVYIRHEEYFEQFEAQIYVFCGGHWGSGPRLWNVWKNNFLIPMKNLDLKCPHVLSGRNLKVSYNFAPPFAYINPATGEITGSDIDFVNDVANKFNFTINWVQASTIFNYTNFLHPSRNNSFSMLVNWRTTFAGGGRAIYSILDSLIHPSPTYFGFGGFAQRIPIEKRSFSHLFRPFPQYVWILVYISLISLSLAFAVTYQLYKKLIPFDRDLLQSSNIPVMDFLLLPLAKFAEPDPIPWFKYWSTGRFLVLLWSISTMMIIFFYSSNLRANLMKADLEEIANSASDLIRLDKVTYLPINAPGWDHKIFPEKMMPEEIEVSIKADKDNSRIGENGDFFPDFVRRNVLEKGHVAYVSFQFMLYDSLWRNNNGGGYSQFIFGDQTFGSHTALHFRRKSPYMEDLEIFLAQVYSMGFYSHYLYHPIAIPFRKPWSPKNSRAYDTPLSLEQFAVINIFLLSGLLLGFLTFIYEVVSKKHMKA